MHSYLKSILFSETNMNYLLLTALEKVAYLPFAFLVDQVMYRKKKVYDHTCYSIRKIVSD